MGMELGYLIPHPEAGSKDIHKVEQNEPDLFGKRWLDICPQVHLGAVGGHWHHRPPQAAQGTSQGASYRGNYKYKIIIIGS